MTNDDLENLLQRAADGDADARDAFARWAVPQLRRALNGRVARGIRARVDTDDLVQSAVMDALRGLPGFDYRGPGAVKRWLGAVGDRTVLMAVRRHEAAKRDHRQDRGLVTGDVLQGVVTSPSRAAARQETHVRIRDALAFLSDEDREVVVLHSIEGHGFREIAERLGLKDRDAARYRFRRALKALGKVLGAGAERHE